MYKKILLFVSTLIFLALGTSAFAESSAILVTPSSYNFGDVIPSNGPVSTVFEIKNTGNTAIKINRLSTSCGCTTATMDMADLAPGETRNMSVTFDPNVHPDQSGRFVRVVYLQTSDVITPEIEIELTGNVVRKNAIVFFNEACQDCGELVKNDLPIFFAKYEYTMEKKDYINARSNRKLLNEYNERWKVPFELQSHIETFVGDKLLLGGACAYKGDDLSY